MGNTIEGSRPSIPAHTAEHGQKANNGVNQVDSFVMQEPSVPVFMDSRADIDPRKQIEQVTEWAKSLDVIDIQNMAGAAAIIRRHMGNSDLAWQALNAYKALAPRFSHTNSLKYTEANALREIISSHTGLSQRIATKAYDCLSATFDPQDPGIFDEIKISFIMLMKTLERWAWEQKRSKRFLGEEANPIGGRFDGVDDAVDIALRSYTNLEQKFRQGTPDAEKLNGIIRSILLHYETNSLQSVDSDFFSSLFFILKKLKIVKVEPYELASALVQMSLQSSVTENIVDKFFQLEGGEFFKQAFSRGNWIDALNLSPEASATLRDMAEQRHFIYFRESIKIVLASLALMSDDKRRVVDAILKATNLKKTKGTGWKSVRNTVRTLGMLLLLDQLPRSDVKEFYEGLPLVSGDPRADIRLAVATAISKYHVARLRGVGVNILLTSDKPPEDPDEREKWNSAQSVFEALRTSRTMEYFMRSATHMTEAGLNLLRDILNELITSPVADGAIDYRARYDRMISHLGFSSDFVDRWRKEWRPSAAQNSSEHVEITGRVDAMARHGMVPNLTCQTLPIKRRGLYNTEGQPLAKIYWGLFKVANYIVNDEVKARRVIEATRDKKGQVHLLVEHMYISRGFKHKRELDQAIMAYAQSLGLGTDHVHFVARGQPIGTVPRPLKTGQIIYRDSKLPEIEPPGLLPIDMSQPAPTMMPSAQTFVQPLLGTQPSVMGK